MNDYAQKTKEELLGMIREKREALRVFRFSFAGSKVKNVKEGRNLRKDIARMLTSVTAKMKNN